MSVRGKAAAVREALGAADQALDEARGEQFGLFEPAGRRMSADEAAAERRGGRPRGAIGWRTRQVAEHLKAIGADPLAGLARWLTISPEEMAARLGIKVSEAFDRQAMIMRELLPYVHARLAPVDDRGNAVMPVVVMDIGGRTVGGDAGASVPPWEMWQAGEAGSPARTIEGAPARIEQNQSLSEADPVPSGRNGEDEAKKP